MIQYDIVRRPILTEKTILQKEKSGQITFEVDKCANRIEIGKAVENIFNVKVTSVKTQMVKGKKVRRGRYVGKKKDWKKAIVKLNAGDRIDFFEGV